MSSPIYCFDGYRLDPARRELWYGDNRVVLQPKAFDCLIYLIEHRDRAVGRDELISAVWAKVNINGTLLRLAILNIRRAINVIDAARDVVRTVPNFGYRWSIDVVVDRTGDASLQLKSEMFAAQHVNSSSAASMMSNPRNTWMPSELRSLAIRWLPIPLALLIFIGLWSHFDARSSVVDSRSVADVVKCADGEHIQDMVAVLPVEAEGDDDSLSWVRLGLMESIAARLGKGGLRVVASEDIIALGESSTPEGLAETVRSATCTRYLVVPRVRRSDSEWLVHLIVSGIGERDREVEANNTELVAAARNASDHLLVMLGRATPGERGDPTALKEDELLARIHIALVTDDLDTAARMIDAAPVAIRASFEFRWKEIDLAFRRGEFDAAKRNLESLRKDAMETRADPVVHARVLTGSGLIDVYRAEPEAALTQLDEAIESFKSPDFERNLGNAYNTRGLAHAMLGKYEQASSDFAAARLAFASAGRTAMLAMVDSNEGMVLLSRNRPADAVALLEQSAERAERFNRIDTLGFALGFLGSSHLALLQPKAALRAFDRFGARLNDKGDSFARCHYQYYYGRVLAANGRLSEARARFNDVLASTIEQCQGTGMAHVALARLDLMEGNVEAALINARKTVDALDNPDDARERAEAWLVLVRALQASGQAPEVQPEIERFSAWAENLGDPAAQVSARLAQAEHAWSEQHHERADKLYMDALRLARSEGVPADVSLVVTSYGHALIAAGDEGHAKQIAAHVTRWVDTDFDSAILLATINQGLGQREQWQTHLDQARALAGERDIPAALVESPAAQLASSYLH